MTPRGSEAASAPTDKLRADMLRTAADLGADIDSKGVDASQSSPDTAQADELAAAQPQHLVEVGRHRENPDESRWRGIGREVLAGIKWGDWKVRTALLGDGLAHEASHDESSEAADETTTASQADSDRHETTGSDQRSMKEKLSDASARFSAKLASIYMSVDTWAAKHRADGKRMDPEKMGRRINTALAVGAVATAGLVVANFLNRQYGSGDMLDASPMFDAMNSKFFGMNTGELAQAAIDAGDGVTSADTQAPGDIRAVLERPEIDADTVSSSSDEGVAEAASAPEYEYEDGRSMFTAGETETDATAATESPTDTSESASAAETDSAETESDTNQPFDVQHGSSYTQELVDAAAERGVDMSGEQAWAAHQQLVDAHGADYINLGVDGVNDTYSMGESKYEVGLSSPTETATWDTDALDMINDATDDGEINGSTETASAQPSVEIGNEVGLEIGFDQADSATQTGLETSSEIAADAVGTDKLEAAAERAADLAERADAAIEMPFEGVSEMIEGIEDKAQALADKAADAAAETPGFDAGNEVPPADLATEAPVPELPADSTAFLESALNDGSLISELNEVGRHAGAQELAAFLDQSDYQYSDGTPLVSYDDGRGIYVFTDKPLNATFTPDSKLLEYVNEHRHALFSALHPERFELTS